MWDPAGQPGRWSVLSQPLLLSKLPLPNLKARGSQRWLLPGDIKLWAQKTGNRDIRVQLMPNLGASSQPLLGQTTANDKNDHERVQYAWVSSCDPEILR